MIGRVITLTTGLVGVTLSRPNGAPGCNVQGALNMVGPIESQDLGFTLSAPPSYTAGQPFDVTIDNSQGQELKGLLIYAEPETITDQENPARIGDWVNFNTENWKAAACDGQCMGGTVCGLTHTSSAPKPGPVTLSLMIPQDMGGLILKAAVAMSPAVAQVLADVPIAGSGGEYIVDPGMNPPPPQGGQCDCQPIRRCKKWKNGGYGSAPGLPPMAPGIPDTQAPGSIPPPPPQGDGYPVGGDPFGAVPGQDPTAQAPTDDLTGLSDDLAVLPPSDGTSLDPASSDGLDGSSELQVPIPTSDIPPGQGPMDTTGADTGIGAETGAATSDPNDMNSRVEQLSKSGSFKPVVGGLVTVMMMLVVLL